MLDSLYGHRYVESFEYDNWGNIIYRTSSGGKFADNSDDLEEWFTYKNTDSEDDPPADGAHTSPYTSDDSPVPRDIHDRPLSHYVLIHTPVVGVADGQPIAGTMLQETVYKYDDNGRLTEQATWEGAGWLKTIYSYDIGWTKPKETKKEINNIVFEDVGFAYDIYGNLIAKTQNVSKADGTYYSIISRWGYDSIWG